MRGELATAFRSFATCGFSSHIVSKPRFVVRQASAWPKKNRQYDPREFGVADHRTKELFGRAVMPLLQDGEEPRWRHAHFGVLQGAQAASLQVADLPDTAVLLHQDQVLLQSRRAPMIWLESNRSPICRYSMTFTAMASNWPFRRSEEHTSELQSLRHLVCRL